MRPSSSASWTFNYNAESGIVVRFYLKALYGSIKLIVSSPGRQVLLAADSSTHSPAVLALSPVVPGVKYEPDYPWTVSVINNGVKANWRLHVDVVDDSTPLNAHYRDLLSSLHSECCPASGATAASSACKLLREWARPHGLQQDACHYGLNYCRNGVLQLLTLTGAGGAPAFNQHCTDQVPAALAKMVDMKYLDFTGLGVHWPLGELLLALRPMENLSDLFLGVNAVHGELQGKDICDYFQEARLRTLWLGNPHKESSSSSASTSSLEAAEAARQIPPRQPQPWARNAISGSIADCVLTSRLELLNLDQNQVSQVPSVSTQSALRHVHLKEQRTSGPYGRLTLAGTQMPDKFSSNGVQFLDLAGNGLWGSPDIFNQTVALEWLDLSGNNLSGDITSTLTALTNLAYINLAGNTGLACDVPALSSTLQHLESINMNATAAYGDLTNSNWKSQELHTIKLAMTRVTGKLPKDFATLPQLTTLDLSSNPGLHSMYTFAAALPHNSNKITYFNVSNCSFVQLPNGIQNLGYFTEGCNMNPKGEPIGTSCSRCVDVSGNYIWQEMPSWLLGPYSSSCFSSQTSPVSCLHVQWQRSQEYAIGTHGYDERHENKFSCPATAFSKMTVEFVEAFLSPRLAPQSPTRVRQGVYCIDKLGKEVPIAQHVQQQYNTYKIQFSPEAGSKHTTHPTGLSSDKIAGITIGTVVGTVLLIGLVLSVYLHRARKRLQKTMQQQEGEGYIALALLADN